MKIKLLLLVIVLISCSTPQESLQNNDYEGAYKSALRALKAGKSYEKNQETLITALNEIIAGNRAKVALLQQSGSVKHLKKAIKINEQLQDKIKKSSSFTDDAFTKTELALTQESQSMQERIREEYLRLGMLDLEAYHATKSKDHARKAYDNFKRSKDYGSRNASIDSLMDRTLELGQVIYTIETSTLFSMEHAWAIDDKLDDLDSYDAKFRKVYFNPIASIKDADCQIVISFNALEIETEEDQDEEDVEKEITTTQIEINADGEEEEVESSTIVNATIVTTKRIKTATWEVDINVSGSKNCEIRDTNFEESIESETVQIDFEGDERAVPRGSRPSKGDELMEEDEMVEELLEVIYDRITSAIF